MNSCPEQLGCALPGDVAAENAKCWRPQCIGKMGEEPVA